MPKITSHADVPKGSNNSVHPQMTQLRPYLHLNKSAYKTLFQQYNDPIYSYILIRTMHNEVLRRVRNTWHSTTDNITIIRIGNALVYDLCFLTRFRLLKSHFKLHPLKSKVVVLLIKENFGIENWGSETITLICGSHPLCWKKVLYENRTKRSPGKTGIVVWSLVREWLIQLMW